MQKHVWSAWHVRPLPLARTPPAHPLPPHRLLHQNHQRQQDRWPVPPLLLLPARLRNLHLLPLQQQRQNLPIAHQEKQTRAKSDRLTMILI